MASANGGQSEPPAFVRVMDRVNHFLTMLCGTALGVAVLSVALGVLVRFVFTHTNYRISLPWTEEVSRYLMIWIVFLGAAVAARSGKLIGVEFIVHALPASLGRFVKYVALVLSMVFYILLCVVGWQWIEFGRSQSSPVLEIPISVVNLAMAAGGLMMLLNTVALIVDARHVGKDIRNSQGDDELESAIGKLDKTPPGGDAQAHVKLRADRAGSML